MKIIISIILLLFFFNSEAQLPEYYVYLVSGGVTITKIGGKTLPVKQTQFVYKTDILVLNKGAEITLVNKEGRFLLLNGAGTFKTNDLIKRTTSKSNNDVTEKYLKLLFHELLDPSHNFEKFKKENIAGVWGGVNRGECGNRIFPVKGLKTSDTSISFKWHKTSPSSVYSLELYTAGGDTTAKMKVPDTTYKMNVNGKTGKYYWRVLSADGKCEDDLLIDYEIMSPEKEKEQTEQLLKNITGKKLEEKLQQIDKLEKNGFIMLASNRYMTLVNANPGNSALLKSYVSFLLKYGFEKEAAALWK